MTDNDIIKALERCIQCNQMHIPNCNGCCFEETYPDCDTEIEIKCLDLITRQKAEIDELRKSEEIAKQNAVNMARAMPNIAKATRIAAIQEFAKRLKAEIVAKCCVVDNDVDYILKFIDNLVKERTEGEDGN